MSELEDEACRLWRVALERISQHEYNCTTCGGAVWCRIGLELSKADGEAWRKVEQLRL